MTTYFSWLDEYNIGSDTIDQQHKYLFDLANQIVDPHNDQQKTYHNVLALYHYTRQHFKGEEALMKQYNYSGYEEHVKEHDLLTKRLDEISAGINGGETSRTDVMEFMRGWLLDHILGKDVLFGDFLRQHNGFVNHNKHTTSA